MNIVYQIAIQNFFLGVRACLSGNNHLGVLSGWNEIHIRKKERKKKKKERLTPWFYTRGGCNLWWLSFPIISSKCNMGRINVKIGSFFEYLEHKRINEQDANPRTQKSLTLTNKIH